MVLTASSELVIIFRPIVRSQVWPGRLRGWHSEWNASPRLCWLDSLKLRAKLS